MNSITKALGNGPITRARREIQKISREQAFKERLKELGLDRDALRKPRKTYNIGSLEEILLLPKSVTEAACCKQGHYYAWHGGLDVRPPCPICYPTKAMPKSKESDSYTISRYKDGVYVDVSARSGRITLGFAVVVDGKCDLYSLGSQHTTNTSAAETEAIKIAKVRYPDMQIFCDHKDSADQEGVTYIPRNLNRLAHTAARDRKNYESRTSD